MSRIVEILAVVVCCAGREIVGVPRAELKPCTLNAQIVVKLFVGALGVGAAPKTERHVPFGKRVVEVGFHHAAVCHLYASPQVVVVQFDREMYLCRGSQGRCRCYNE